MAHVPVVARVWVVNVVMVSLVMSAVVVVVVEARELVLDVESIPDLCGQGIQEVDVDVVVGKWS